MVRNDPRRCFLSPAKVGVPAAASVAAPGALADERQLNYSRYTRRRGRRSNKKGHPERCPFHSRTSGSKLTASPPCGVNETPETNAVAATVCSLAGLEFEDCEHVALLSLGVRTLDVAAFTQWTNGLGILPFYASVIPHTSRPARGASPQQRRMA